MFFKFGLAKKSLEKHVVPKRPFSEALKNHLRISSLKQNKVNISKSQDGDQAFCTWSQKIQAPKQPLETNLRAEDSSGDPNGRLPGYLQRNQLLTNTTRALYIEAEAPCFM